MRPISIIEAFIDLPDPRIDRGKRHSLSDILVLTLCGALCGVDNWVELERFCGAKLKWFRTFLELPNGVPSHDTFGRVFSLLDPDEFRRCFIRWVESLRLVESGDVVAIDGKTIRRSLDAAKGIGPVHMVNAWASEAGVALGQLATADKSNEITAIPVLLAQLRIAGCIVTTDAMGCQKAIAQASATRMPATACSSRRTTPTSTTRSSATSTPRSATASWRRTRPTCRPWTATTAASRSVAVGCRPTSAGSTTPTFGRTCRPCRMVESERTVGDKSGIHRRFFLTTVCDVRKFARVVRSHWGIENSLHWVLDVAFDEDGSRARSGNAAENLAIVRQVALNLLKQEKVEKVGIKTKRKMCGWDHDYMLTVMGLRKHVGQS